MMNSRRLRRCLVQVARCVVHELEFPGSRGVANGARRAKNKAQMADLVEVGLDVAAVTNPPARNPAP